MTNTLQKCQPIIMFSLGAILAVVLALFLREANTVQGGAPSGLRSSNNKVDFVQVGTAGIDSPVVVFTRNPNCVSRIISTGSSTLKIMMASSTTDGFATSTRNLNNTRGLTHLASTTVSYDAEIFGCDYWAAVGTSGASGTTTVTGIENY